MHAASRRRFLLHSAACGLGLAGNWAFAVDGEAEIAVPVLGDLHFDRPEHHDLKWLARVHPGDVRQVQNYSEITRERTPRLLARVVASCGHLQQAGATVPFILQLGDLLEGLCGSPELALRQAREALDFWRQAQLPAPLVMTKGNHDITGPGAAEAYGQTVLPFLAADAGAKVDRASFTRSTGGTLWVMYDAYDRGSLDWFAGVLEQHKPQRLVVAVHPPVVPYNARSTWHVYSAPKHTRQRQRLLALLGRHRAIVLCGHLHKYSFLVRRTEQGAFAQLAISSVASTSDARVKDERSREEEYGPDLVELEPKHSPETIDERRAWLATERPHIAHFEYADTWGRGTIHLRGNQATAQVFRGLEQQPWKRLDLSGSLA